MREVLVLYSEHGLRSVAIEEISTLDFEESELRKKLQLAMKGVVKQRHASEKKLCLRFQGKGKRKVRFAYVKDAPVWRMTYHLAEIEDRFVLLGRVHLSNVSRNDWNKVHLDLRGGRPQLFHANLYAPVLGKRRSIGLEPFGFPNDLTLVEKEICI